jgi:hypothetical protein
VARYGYSRQKIFSYADQNGTRGASVNSIGVAPVDRHALTKRFGAAVLVGATGALLTTAVVPGIRRDLAEVAATPIFWARIALPLSLTIGSLQMSTPSP